jgi:ABC-type multidrug transport system fused ATPase/permease subunit
VIRSLLLILGLLGALLFGAAFVTSIVNPGYVEELAKDIIRQQIEKKVHEKIEALDAKFLTRKAGGLIEAYSTKVQDAKRQINEKLPERLALVIAEMRNLDCECRQKIQLAIREGFEWQIVATTQMQAQLTQLIRAKYMETAEKITREFRIFSGTNASVFALLTLAAVLKRGAGVHLIAPAIALIVAASITAGLYVFNQDWLHTVVFSDYVGFAYVGYLSIVFALLCDILFNRARITTKILNITFNVVGSTLQVAPC